MAAFDFQDNFDGTAGTINGHVPSTSVPNPTVWTVLGGAGDFVLGSGLATSDGGNPTSGGAIAFLPSLPRYSAFVFSASVIVNAAAAPSSQTISVGPGEANNGGGGVQVALFLTAVDGSGYHFNVNVYRALNWDSSSYIDAPPIVVPTNSFDIQIAHADGTLTVTINGSVAYAEAIALDPLRFTEGWQRLVMYALGSNAFSAISFGGTIYEPVIPPVGDSFHIRDDFDGVLSLLNGKTPNIVEGVGALEVVWDAEGDLPVPGDPGDNANFGWIVDDGEVFCKGQAI
ncbi:hypothetical protein ABL850_15555 [Variovorax paradoxus]|uniref:hypothetical protein n=1 Tax=Variovorax paradoxus TaxID=34073 RepID=UPI000413D486